MPLPRNLITGRTTPKDLLDGTAPLKQQPRKYAGGTKRGEMNRTEARYADHLELQRRAGVVLAWWYEAITFTLAHGSKGKRGVYWCPDFVVLLRDGTVELVDVKGGRGWQEAQRAKAKLVADKFKQWRVVGETWDGTVFVREEF